MSVTTAIAIYFLIWWVTLFAVLPWGVRPQAEAERAPGTDPGAPALPMLLTKLIWTTVVSGVIFAICYVIYTWRLITLDDLSMLLGFRDLK
jgi:predicted secreted protein